MCRPPFQLPSAFALQKRFSLGLLFVVLLPALATDPALRLQLHRQAQAGAKVIPYSSSSRFDTADALAAIDAVAGDTNSVSLIYAQTTLPTASFGDAGGWNREHLWPNSYGLDDVEPAFSDLHNLRACDSNVNSARGNKFFDLSRAADGNLRIPAHAEAPLCSTDSNSWQPPESQRGDIARALFYMDVRFDGEVPGEPDLALVEDVSTIGSNFARMGRLSVLLLWNEQDPPDDAERARDAAVREIQGNANPFVGDPSLVNRIWMPRVEVTASESGPVFAVEPTELPVILEFAPEPSGPWRTNFPTTGVSQFARVRLFPQ